MSVAFRYPDIAHGSDRMVVEKLDRQQALDLVPGIVDLTRRAYSRELEVPNGPLLPGFVDANYTLDAKARPTETRVGIVYGDGGAYYIVRSPDAPERLDGLVNIKPMYGGHPFDYGEASYIHDGLADPARQGIGSAALHAALLDVRGMGEDRVRDLVYLDSLNGSTAAQWCRDIGFDEEGPSDGWELAGQEVGTTRMSAPSVLRILTRLEEKNPRLANVERVAAT